MGLGALADVGLKDARDEAERWRAVLRRGQDPIKERERLRRESAKEDTTFKSIAAAAFDARKAELKGDGTAGRWFSPLALHIVPKLGKVPIEEINQADLRNVLAPIWHEKGETARKALGRVMIVFKHAAAMGLDVDLQAPTKAKELLGRSRQQQLHIPALPWKDAPTFYQSLRDDTLTVLAIRILLLTAVRSGSLRMAKWDQFGDDVWEIPAENMKGLRGRTMPFRVPLSAEVVRNLDKLRPFAREGYLFPGRRDGVMSDMTMNKFLKDGGHLFRPHGFRSSFRTWCADATDVPREIAEAALAHTDGSKVERSYRRTDYLDRRRVLMERWADFVSGAGA